MKTKEELNAIKEEVETVNKKLAELSEEELAQVTGGINGLIPCVPIYGALSNDGRPGASMSIRVRGGGSITQSNDPLFIVDGMPAGSDPEK